jgi:hypothetical protein
MPTMSTTQTSAPNVRKWKNALLRDDGADQKRAERDDRHRAPADALEVMHHRGEPQPRRMGERADATLASAPRRCASSTSDWLVSAIARPMPSSGAERVLTTARVGNRGAVGEPRPFHEAAVGLCKPDDAHGRAVRDKGAA